MVRGSGVGAWSEQGISAPEQVSCGGGLSSMARDDRGWQVSLSVTTCVDIHEDAQIRNGFDSLQAHRLEGQWRMKVKKDGQRRRCKKAARPCSDKS